MENLKKDYLVIKQDISAFGRTMIEKGVYVKDDIKAYMPWLDFNNKKYFETVTKDIIATGSKVKYKGNNYYMIKTADEIRHSGYGGFRPFKIQNSWSYCPNGDVNPESIRVPYYICYNMKGKSKDFILVHDSEIAVPRNYWFINSKGEPSQALEGDKTFADSWRKLNGNFFLTKEECVKYKMNLIEMANQIVQE